MGSKVKTHHAFGCESVSHWGENPFLCCGRAGFDLSSLVSTALASAEQGREVNGDGLAISSRTETATAVFDNLVDTRKSTQYHR
jgi:hypothetical protein